MEESARISSIEPLLNDVYAKTASGDYAEAFILLEMARSADPGNIYFDALKKELGLMFSREKSETLNAEQRREMMEALPGIIQCAVRDTRRHPHPTLTAPPSKPELATTPETSDPTEDDARKELDALKLIYFQRASKFVMKGDYEQALAEVKRVFIVDPESTIARKYATRVEDLIKHARHLAAAPADSAPETPAVIAPPARTEQSPPVHSQRSTAWDDTFESPTSAKPISERRYAPPSSRETVAYGNSLKPYFAPPGTPGTARNDESTPARSRKTVTMVGVIIIVLIASGTFALITKRTTGSASKRADFAVQADDADVNSIATGTLLSQPVLDVQSAQQQSVQQQTGTPLSSPAVSKPPTDDLRAETDPRTVEPTNEPSTKNLRAGSSPPLLAISTPERAEPRVIEMKPATSKGLPVSAPTYVPVQKEPQILKLETPQFPTYIWNSFEEGTVVIRVLIDEQGRPVQTQILKSTSGAFEQPVVDALMKSEFAAGQMGNGPVSAWLTIPFRIRQPK